jgi:hypothetical protein
MARDAMHTSCLSCKVHKVIMLFTWRNETTAFKMAVFLLLKEEV